MATLIIHGKTTGHTGSVEDVVVTEKCQGLGAGRKLMELLVKTAWERKLDCLELTSNPQRKKAQALYMSLGFRPRETNCFRLNL